MSVGLVHFPGPLGEGVRVEAIRLYLDDHAIPYREYRLGHERPRVDILREALSPAGLRHLARKLFLDRAHPFLKEVHWRIEARQWERSIEQAVERLQDDSSSVRIFVAETLFAGIVCLRLKERRRKPFVFDIHGVAREESRLTGSREWRAWCEKWERRVMDAADRVLVVSPLMADYVERVYRLPRERLCLIPNGSDPTERRARFGEPQVVVYAGNLAPYEQVLEFARTAELAAGSSLQFWLLGDGVLRNEILDYVNARSLDVVYWGRKPRAVALDYCARAQIGFLGQSGAVDLERDFPRQLGCPIKLFDYASCGLPVVVPPGEWSTLVREADCGVVAERCDAVAFLEAIRQLGDRAVWERKSTNAKELIKTRYGWDRVLAPLSQIIQGEH